jgi:hypothetical protein
MQTIRPHKIAEQEELTRQVEEFLARGGEIQQIDIAIRTAPTPNIIVKSQEANKKRQEVGNANNHFRF